VILDIQGELFYAPSFSEFDHYTVTVGPGITDVVVIDSFHWPSGAGSLDNIRWYSFMTDPEITSLLGDFDTWEFAWGE
jgi:hypothetical protein